MTETRSWGRLEPDGHAQPVQTRCDLTDLLVDQCGCRHHRGGQSLIELAVAHRAELLKRPDWHAAIYPGQCGICHKPFQPGTAIAAYFDGPGWRAECCS